MSEDEATAKAVIVCYQGVSAVVYGLVTALALTFFVGGTAGWPTFEVSPTELQNK